MSNRSFRASSAGRKVAQDAFDRLGIGQEMFAQRAGVSRSTIYKFFKGKPILKRVFIEICTELKLDWKTIADIENEESQNIQNEFIESQARTLRRVRAVTAGYTPSSLERIKRFSEPAANWLECNSEQIAIEVCEAILGDNQNITIIEKKDFQNDICYYLDLVAQSLKELDSTIYYLPNMKNHFSLYDISLYLQAFQQIAESVPRRASTELEPESVAELEFRIDELLKYLETRF